MRVSRRPPEHERMVPVMSIPVIRKHLPGTTLHAMVCLVVLCIFPIGLTFGQGPFLNSIAHRLKALAQNTGAGADAPLHNIKLADGSTIGVPQGWTITAQGRGSVDLAGPNGEGISLGAAAPVYSQAPRAPYLPPGYLLEAPCCNPVRAYQILFPQIAAGIAKMGGPVQQLQRIIETQPAQFPGRGQAAFILVELLVAGRPSLSYCLVIASPNYSDPWTFYLSGVLAPKELFQAELPLMLKVWKSFTANPDSFPQHLQRAVQSMSATSGQSPQQQTGDRPITFPPDSAWKLGKAKPLPRTAPTGLPANASARARAAWSAFSSASTAPQYAQARVDEKTLYFVTYVEFQNVAARQAFRVPGATVFAAYDRFADVFVPPNADGQGPDMRVISAIVMSRGFFWMDEAEPVLLPPPTALQEARPTRALAEQIVRGGFAGLTGKHVIIAVVDSGLDFRNPDFITYDNSGQPTSRLLYLWDTTSQTFDASGLGSRPPIRYPNGASVGTLYTRDQLTAELRSGSRRIPGTDEAGHGTGAAGVAAGNGNNAKRSLAHAIGVAPNADLIAVRIGGAGGSLQNGYLLNAAAGWIDSVARAANEPVVINCSFGGHSGAHDGNTVEEREINARFAPGVRGRAIVISAGNDQEQALHAHLTFGNSQTPALLKWFSQEGTRLQVFFRIPNMRQIDLRGLGLAPAENVNPPDPNVPRSTAQPGRGYPYPFASEYEIPVYVTPGFGAAYIWDDSGQITQAEVYLYTGRGNAVAPATFLEIVGNPGTASAAITVGSYDWNDQLDKSGQIVSWPAPCYRRPPDNLPPPVKIHDLSCYSSPGYSRSGAVKPEIVAPGEWYTASFARLPDGTGSEIGNIFPVDASGNYVGFNGTSAAAPYVTGIVALMMEKKPTITAGEIKNLLKRYATADAYTGSVPNPKWGYGKLDLAAVRSILGAIQ